MARHAKTKNPFDDRQTDESVVFARTSDGLSLSGVLIRAKADSAPKDILVIWVHTRQQNFAEPEYVDIGRRFARSGHAFLSINTRGHDFGSWFRQDDDRPVLHGSAWEMFTDCVYDLDAWVEQARVWGYRKIMLVGHGFGGAKVVHYQSQRQRPEIVAIGLASSGSAVRDKFTETARAEAAAMVADGRGRDLMPWGTGGDTYDSTVSADWYMARTRLHEEVYGDAVTPPAIARINVPILAWYGAKEDRETRKVSEFLKRLREDATQTPLFIGHIVDGLGFFYRGQEAKVVELLHSAVARIDERTAA